MIWQWCQRRRSQMFSQKYETLNNWSYWQYISNQSIALNTLWNQRKFMKLYRYVGACVCVPLKLKRWLWIEQKKLDRNEITLTFARDEHSWYTKYSQWVKCTQAKNASSILYARWIMQSIIQIFFLLHCHGSNHNRNYSHTQRCHRENIDFLNKFLFISPESIS